MEFIVRVETVVVPQEGGQSEAFAEAMLQALAVVDPDSDMASGTREGVYNFWTLVEAEAPEVAALKGADRIRGVARNVGGDANTSKVWPSWARAQSVEAYPSVDQDGYDMAAAG